MSATSIGCFKACPMRYYYRYPLGLVPIAETDATRMGTNYHKIHEIADLTPGGACPDCREIGNETCILCAGTKTLPDNIMDAVIRHLNKSYAQMPMNKTPEEWETERITLLYSLIGYQWLYQDPGYVVEKLEQKFRIPLLSPISGHKLQAELIGKIDRTFSAESNRFVHEYKSTSKGIEPDSTYWNHLTLDTQTRLYTYAARRLGLGQVGVLYDVWHKPKTAPKNLTQGESAEFVKNGIYCDTKFEIHQPLVGNAGDYMITVNGQTVQVEPGKKPGTFAIRETPEMYGARLLQDITIRPDYYFARKELAHNDDDIKAFEWELFNIYTSIRMMAKSNSWYRNEDSCESKYKCDFINFCYNHINIGPQDIPDGFQKRSE
jgi:hypothetical protein